MIKIKYLLFICTSILLFTSCSDDDTGPIEDIKPPPVNTNLAPFKPLGVDPILNNEIRSFIFHTLFQVYLYKDKSFNLSDNRFQTRTQLNDFIIARGTPESFFEKLLYDKDRFSFLLDDFDVLEGFFRGKSLSNGLKFRRIRYAGDNVFIVITDVVKNSPAANAGIKRGMLFNKINGVQMNINNQAKLFEDNSFTIEEANIINNTIVDNGNTINLTKVSLIENPISVSKVITVNSQKIGYLMYNGFLTNFEEELNNEFGKFKTEGIRDLVLDFRYNGGGSVNTANILSGMITGDLTGEILIKEKWNKRIQENFEKNNPEQLIERFKDTTAQGTKINTLGLSKLYVITSKEETASSSELVINSLKPYIDVVVIGDENGTVGKSQGSITLYDSPNFSKEDVNPDHKYVLQPLVIESVNSNDIGVPIDGIKPDIIAKEDIQNLGILGDENEPLLKVAIDDITGRNTPSAKKINRSLGSDIGGSQENSPSYQRMYLPKKDFLLSL